MFLKISWKELLIANESWLKCFVNLSNSLMTFKFLDYKDKRLILKM